MAEIIKHTFETAFADRSITGPHRFFSDHSKLYHLLKEKDSVFPVTVHVQCCSPRIAERMLRQREIKPLSKNDFLWHYDQADFSHIEIGKTLVFPKIRTNAPLWSDLREWMTDALMGKVSAFVGDKETRLSFADEGDYTLTRLAWG